MPTDPFVSPDPSSRPRQQQNLPPGVALPPATHWTAGRPGDLPVGQPEGKLLGAPGPNVGFAYTLAERVKDRLRLSPNEHTHDVLPVIAEVAGHRAAQFGRAPVIGDVELAMMLLGYDGSATDDPNFVGRRALLVQHAGHDYRRRRTIVDAIPASVLRAKPADARAEAVGVRFALASIDAEAAAS